MRIVYQRCCGMDVHKDSVTACVLLIDEYGEWRSEKRKFRTAAMVNAGPPGPVTTSRTVCPLLISASSTRACVTGANICRMISRCFSQNGAEPRHALIAPWSGCIKQKYTYRPLTGRPSIVRVMEELPTIHPECAGCEPHYTSSVFH